MIARKIMRIDKYLKVTHIIKRREVAKQMLDAELISINGKISKPSSEVRIGDVVTINAQNGKTMTFKVVEIKESCPLSKVNELYEIM